MCSEYFVHKIIVGIFVIKVFLKLTIEKSWGQTCFQVQEQYCKFTSLYCIIIITRRSRILKQIVPLSLFYYVLPLSTFSYNYFYLHGIYSCTTNAISILKTFYICFYYARNREAAEQYGFIPANQQRSGYVTDNDIIACNQSTVTWGISHLCVLSGNWVFLPLPTLTPAVITLKLTAVSCSIFCGIK